LQRVLTTVTLLGLLVATAAAFAITEHLKLIKSPVFGPLVSKTFSPACHCLTDRAHVSIRLRHSTVVTVTIVDSHQKTVATLAYKQPEPKGRAHWPWDGRTDAGTAAPDGVYRPEISLPHRTYLLVANRIVLDTIAPKVLSARGGKTVLLAGPRRSVAIRYDLSEQAHALVYLDGRRIIRGRPIRQRDKVKWAGTLGGRPLPPGSYVLSVGAQDDAGNVTPAASRKNVTVVVRYIVLAPARLAVRSGARFKVHVHTAAPRYTWRLGHRHGAQRGKVLRLRAPTTPGTYRLVVSENGHAATAVVRVRAK
jgi:flagellar hook capping protein FlgD